MKVKKTIKLFIGGKFPRSESGRVAPQYFAASKTKVSAHYCQASRKDFRASIEANKKAEGPWAARSAYNRGQILYRIAENLEMRRGEFEEIFISILGYSKSKANKTLEQAIAAFVYYAGFADKYSQVLASLNPVQGSQHNFTFPEAIGSGVLAEGSSTKFVELCNELAALLATGNVVTVLQSPTCALLLSPFAEVLATSDVPAGVVNLLSASNDELMPVAASHMDVLYITLLEDKDLALVKGEAIHNLKRVFRAPANGRSIESIAQAVEYKTTWHPTGF